MSRLSSAKSKKGSPRCYIRRRDLGGCDDSDYADVWKAPGLFFENEGSVICKLCSKYVDKWHLQTDKHQRSLSYFINNLTQEAKIQQMQEWSTNYRRKYPKARIAEPSDGNEALTSVLGPMEKEPTPVDLSVYIPQPRTLLEVAPIPATSTRAPSEPEVIHASKDSAGVHLAKKDIRSFLNGMLTRGDPGRCALLEKNSSVEQWLQLVPSLARRGHTAEEVREALSACSVEEIEDQNGHKSSPDFSAQRGATPPLFYGPASSSSSRQHDLLESPHFGARSGESSVMSPPPTALAKLCPDALENLPSRCVAGTHKAHEVGQACNPCVGVGSDVLSDCDLMDPHPIQDCATTVYAPRASLVDPLTTPEFYTFRGRLTKFAKLDSPTPAFSWKPRMIDHFPYVSSSVEGEDGSGFADHLRLSAESSQYEDSVSGLAQWANTVDGWGFLNHPQLKQEVFSYIDAQRVNTKSDDMAALWHFCIFDLYNKDLNGILHRLETSLAVPEKITEETEAAPEGDPPLADLYSTTATNSSRGIFPSHSKPQKVLADFTKLIETVARDIREYKNYCAFFFSAFSGDVNERYREYYKKTLTPALRDFYEMSYYGVVYPDELEKVRAMASSMATNYAFNLIRMMRNMGEHLMEEKAWLKKREKAALDKYREIQSEVEEELHSRVLASADAKAERVTMESLRQKKTRLREPLFFAFMQLFPDLVLDLRDFRRAWKALDVHTVEENGGRGLSQLMVDIESFDSIAVKKTLERLEQFCVSQQERQKERLADGKDAHRSSARIKLRYRDLLGYKNNYGETALDLARYYVAQHQHENQANLFSAKRIFDILQEESCRASTV